jgi:ABC-2 type transport system permease protein
MKGNDLKNKAITRFGLICIVILLLNILSTRFHKRFDVTTEKRFSLSDPTKKLLKNLNETVVVEVYLKGNFPAGFQRLASSARDVLQEFKEYGGNKVRFSFTNPTEGKTDTEKQKIYMSFSEKGLNPVNLKIQRDEEDGYAEKIIFPVAKVSYNNKEMPVNLLENHSSLNPSEKLNYSETMLEYKLASAIKHLMDPDRKKIAYLVGHDEMLSEKTADMLTTFEKYYDVDTLDITQDIEIKRVYSAAIICGSQEEFDEKNKFKIDQYVMNGGRILWCLDALRIEMDSLQTSNATMAVDYNLNLDDLLFEYGARINHDLIEDYQQANPIPITVGMNGDQPDIRLLPWSYYPFAIPNSPHPIVKNMDAVNFMMASSIDTSAATHIKKTILLTSSNRSRKVPSPVRISLANLKFKPTADMFKEKNIPMAVLLEGKFKSIYTNRIDPNFIATYTDSLHKTFAIECATENKMIVISDANMFTNDFSRSKGMLECGYYKYTQQLFANKTFLLNCVEYLTDDSGLLEARNKDLKLRLLDTARVKSEKLKWQIINLALPILLVLIFASGYFFFRRKRYEGKVS